jgi:hypothetical protein
MKSARIVYTCSFISGIILFIIGIFFLIDIKSVSSQPQSQDISTPSSNSNSFNIVDNYTGNYNPINF